MAGTQTALPSPSDQYETYFIRELIADVDSRFRTIADRGGAALQAFRWEAMEP